MTTRLLLVALVLGGLVPSWTVASDNVAGTPVVRDFVRNHDAAAWALDLAWTWDAGVLTHHPFIETGAAQQVNMPAYDPGKLYRIRVTFSNYLRGSVTLSLGSNSFGGYGENGRYTFHVNVAEPDAKLAFTPTLDYEGSIGSVHIVELGDELADDAMATWSPDGTLATAASHELLIERLQVVGGRTYQVTFEVDNATGAMPGASVDLGQSGKLFSNNGRYEVDVMADQNGRLVFSPRQADAIYDGAIGKVSVREITSDPTTP